MTPACHIPYPYLPVTTYSVIMRLGLPLLVSALAVGATAKKDKKPNENHIPFDVKIVHTEGTQVTVTLTNKWKSDVNLFKRMSILDPNPVEKVNITSANGTQVLNIFQ